MKTIQLLTIVLLPALASGLLHANPETKKADGKTDWKLFQTAIEAGDTAAVKRLISAGFNVKVKKDHWGETPLHLAAAMAAEHPKASATIAKLLLEAGIDVNSSMINGATPLHEAARAGSEDVAKILIESGADLNRVIDVKGGLDPHYDFNEETPLDMAIAAKKLALAAQLQKSGAKTKEELKKQS